MKFRPATKDDLSKVIDWIPDSQACLFWAGPNVRFPLELEQLSADLEFESTRCYALDAEGELFAFGQIREFENNRGHLSRIVVDPSSRGKGVGRVFVRALVEEAGRLGSKTISLNVMKDNPTAIGLYQSLGFSIVIAQPDTTRNDCYYMEFT